MINKINIGPVLIGLRGTVLSDQERDWLRHSAVGGVVLFSRNYADIGQLQQLIDEIRRARSPRLLIAIDQEGGRVQRLRSGFTSLPPLGSLGRMYADDADKAEDFAYRHGRVMASEMLAVGIDMSFAPVLDLDGGSLVIGDRALSADPATVVSLGRCYLSGMRDAGMASTGKHFPGHGSVLPDSHTDDACDQRSFETLQQTDLRPFAELAGELDALMIAHVVYPCVDRLPAGFSRAWLQTVLRQQMAYSGVVVSDDLGMQAAKVAGGLRDRSVAAIDAGCDLILVCDPDDVQTLLDDPEAMHWPAAADIVERLYGRPGASRKELASVPEFRHWQRSLTDLQEA